MSPRGGRSSPPIRTPKTTETVSKQSSPSSPNKHREFVLDLTPNDVLLGRGSGPNDHVGNIKFRELIKLRKQEYLSTNNRQAKMIIASKIIEIFFQKGGRFLKKLNAVDAAYQLPNVLEKLGDNCGKKQKGNGDDKGADDEEEEDVLDGDHGEEESRDVYEIQSRQIVLEKTKQALRQNTQKRSPASSSSSNPPTGSPGRSSIGNPTNLLQTRTPWPPNRVIGGGGGKCNSLNGFMGGNNSSVNINTNNQYFNNWNNGNNVPTGFNGLSNNTNKISFSTLDFNNNNNIKNKDIVPTPLSPPLLEQSQQQKQHQQLDTYKQMLHHQHQQQQPQHQQQQHQQQQQQQQNSKLQESSLAQSLMQQEFYQLQEQQRMQEKQHRLEKEQYEKQQMQLERQKQELQQQLVLQLQREQLRKLQEMQQQKKQHGKQQQRNEQQNYNNSNRLTTTTTNDTNCHDDRQERQQQQQARSSNNNHKQHQYQHQHQQQNNIIQQQQQRYPTYNTTLEEIEDHRAAEKHGTDTRIRDNETGRDSVQCLGDVTDMMKGSSDHHQQDQNHDSMSTMMESMKDMSVKDDELGGQHGDSSSRSIGSFDSISDKMIVRGLSSAGHNMSGISMMSSTGMNDSTDMLGNSMGKEGSSHQNAFWGNSDSNLRQPGGHHATRCGSTGGDGKQQKDGGNDSGLTRRQCSDEALRMLAATTNFNKSVNDNNKRIFTRAPF